MTRFRYEGPGMAMIVATLAVIGVTLLLLFNFQQDMRVTHIRSQGVGLTRLLGGLSWEQLTSPGNSKGPLQIVQQSQSDPDFAYGVIVNSQNQPVQTVTAPGVIVPDVPLPEEPSSWLGERELLQNGQSLPISEFYAPLFSGGEFAGHIRLGYFEPRIHLSYQQLPFLGTLALPIFLLMPFFYFLLRREIKPLQQINQRIDNYLSENSQAEVKLKPTADLSEFMARFNQFIDLTSSRVHDLEQQQDELFTSGKLLSYRQSRVEVVLHTLPEAVLVLDESGVVSYSNSRLQALLNIDPDDALGKRPSEWCNDPRILSFLARYQGGDNSGFISEPLLLSPPQSPDRTLELSTYPLFSPNDTSGLLGTLVVLRDVTEEQLAKNNRNEFVAQVAHELKTPLNVLALYSESLLEDSGESDEFRIEAVNVIRDEVERLSTLINNLLAITRFEMDGMELNRQRTRLDDLLQDAFANVAQSGLGKDLEFEIHIPRELGAVYVDKDLLRIAINNLLTNAIKYNKSGGKVILEAQEENGEVEICVRDTGIGIDVREQKSIFEKFYRSDNEQVRTQTGHGLGLPLARQIIQLHMGTLTVESEPGNGSAFTIHLNSESAALQYAVQT